MPRIRPGTPTSISRRGYGIAKDHLSDSELDSMRRALTATPAPGPFGRPGPGYPLYRESPSKIYIPKHAGLVAYGQPCSDSTPQGAPMSARFTGSLRASQTAPVEAFLAAARDPGHRGGIINMGCAAGKTVMGINIACRLGLKTLIVVHKEFLARQWEERIEQFAAGASIGRIQGSSFDVDGKDFVVAMVQTMSVRKFDDDAFDSFGTVIVDECHHMSAEVFCRSLHRTFRHSLGLSATLRRADGLSHVFQWFIGDVVFRSSRPKGEAVHVEVHAAKSSRPIADVYTRGSVVNVSRVVSDVCEDPSRLQAVARIISDTIADRPGAKILVLSERRTHLRSLSDAIDARGARIAFYVGGMKQGDLKAAEDADVVLGTFAMAAEGMDIPSLDTLVLASPKGNIEQPVGRILRVRPEDRGRPPLVIDIVDDSQFLSALASRRAAFYSRAGYVVSHRAT